MVSLAIDHSKRKNHFSNRDGDDTFNCSSFYEILGGEQSFCLLQSAWEAGIKGIRGRHVYSAFMYEPRDVNVILMNMTWTTTLNKGKTLTNGRTSK